MLLLLRVLLPGRRMSGLCRTSIRASLRGGGGGGATHRIVDARGEAVSWIVSNQKQKARRDAQKVSKENIHEHTDFAAATAPRARACFSRACVCVCH